MYVAGAITSLTTTSITVQVTNTGPHDTKLHGQLLTVAINPDTSILIDGQPGSVAGLHTGEPVSLRIRITPTGYAANQISG